MLTAREYELYTIPISIEWVEISCSLETASAQACIIIYKYNTQESCAASSCSHNAAKLGWTVSYGVSKTLSIVAMRLKD